MKTLQQIDRETRRLEGWLKTRHEPIVIAGRVCTYHAVARMMAREIPAQWVEEALTTNPRNSVKGSVKFDGERATVTVNGETGKIVTVGYGQQNDPFYSHREDWRTEARRDNRRRSIERLMMPS